MRTIHVYSLDDEPYASAAEVVPAIRGKQRIKVVCHSVTTDILGALLAAVGRATNSLRYSRAGNIQAALISVAVLVLLSWPLIYNAISTPEVALAARLAASVFAVLSLLSVATASVQIHLVRKHARSMASRMDITRRDDNLLANATAWGRDTRRAAFPWLGLGLVLFSIALNCVVVGSYANPAILNNGTVHHRVALALPWTGWQSGARYIADEFVVPFGKMWEDPQYVFRVSYRVRNLDPDIPIPGLETWEASLFFVARHLVDQVSSGVRTEAPARATTDEITRSIEAELTVPDALEAFTNWFNKQVLDKYPNLQLEHVKLTVEVMSQSKFSAEYKAQLRRWQLQ